MAVSFILVPLDVDGDTPEVVQATLRRVLKVSPHRLGCVSPVFLLVLLLYVVVREEPT